MPHFTLWHLATRVAPQIFVNPQNEVLFADSPSTKRDLPDRGGGAAWVRASARRPRLHVAGLIANSGPGFMRHKAGSTERGGSSSALPWVRTCARASGMWVSLPLVWGGALSVANAIFIWCFFRVLSQDSVRCAVHRAAPSCPGRTCTSAYARAEMRMRVPPPLVWGRALSVATVFFVWFFFSVSSQYLVRCAVHSAAPSRPRGTRTCAYARRARARTEMRDVSGRDRDDAPRSSLRGQLGGTVIVCAICAISTARLKNVAARLKLVWG